MELTTFQHAELRDSSDNIVQEGAYGKESALVNGQNTGWIDYVQNNLEVLYNSIEAASGVIDLSEYLKIADAEAAYAPLYNYIKSINGVAADENGNIDIAATIDAAVATSSTLGLVKGGGNVNIANDGTMSVVLHTADISDLDLSIYALRTELPTDYVDNSTFQSTLADYALAEDVPDVTGFLRTTTAANTYLSIADAAATYQPYGEYALATDLPDMTQYLTSAETADTYLTQSDAETYYLGITAAAETYQPIGDYVTSVNGEQPGEDGDVTIDLSDYATTESLATVATSGLYSDLSGTPTLATVATSGSYNDLTNTPTIPTVPTTVSSFTNDAGYITASSDITGNAATATKATQDASGNVITTTYETKTDATDKYDKLWSLGEQLIINGSGILGDNTNFSAWSFDATNANSSAGSFTRTATTYATPTTDEYIPLNANSKYVLSMDLKSDGTERTQVYAYLSFFDSDKRSISASHHMYIADTLTTLAQDLTAGDTVVYLTDLTNWKVSGTAGHQRGFIFWNYTNGSGYTYPELTYSRNVYGNKYSSDSDVDQTNNTITLASAWTGATIPAGTKVSQSCSGSTYKYAFYTSNLPSDWTSYSGYYDGVDYSGKNVTTKMPPGTAYAKLGFLWNYQSTGGQIWAANISLKAVPKTVDSATSATTADSATTATNSTYATLLKVAPSARPTTANTKYGDGNLRQYKASASMTTGKPPSDAHILHLAWDNTGGWDSQIAVSTGLNGMNKLYTRTQNSGNWNAWKTLATTDEIPTVVSDLTNDSGYITASGSITGNAATASQLTHSFTINGTAFDGSADVSLTISGEGTEITAAEVDTLWDSI